MNLILASQSPYRQNLLRQAGVQFQAVKPPIDEETLKDPNLPPRDLSLMLAQKKAESVADTQPDALVVGCDQVAHIDGVVLHKPGHRERAIEQLLSLQGRQHELVTGLCVIYGNRKELHLDVTRIWLRPLARTEVETYVDLDQPLDCAGAYKLEKAGICLVEKMDSYDQTAIVGLPMIGLTQILLRMNLGLPFRLGSLENR